MQFSISRSLLVILTVLSLTACSTPSTSEGSAAPAAAPSNSVVTPSPSGESAAPPAAPAPITDVAAPSTTKVDAAANARVATPPAPVQATPAALAPAPARKLTLDCTSGTKVSGPVDRWSPLSTCPAGYQVTGLGRIDLQGDHNRPNLHVNDFICDDRGCKAWCIGDGCTVEARCCRISE